MKLPGTLPGRRIHLACHCTQNAPGVYHPVPCQGEGRLTKNTRSITPRASMSTLRFGIFRHEQHVPKQHVQELRHFVEGGF